MILDSQQQQAVETESWRAMVIAGAGSGKTRVLTERVAHLVENCKVSPSEIVVMTFTRKAASEMSSRLEERIGTAAFGLTLGTIHALALRMINRFGEVIGMKSRKVTIYCEWEESYLLRDVALEMGLHDGKKWKGMKAGDVMSVLGGYYQRGVEPEDSDPVHDIFKAFIQRCRENNAMTYGGLMIGLRLLIPTMAKYLNIKHILVDEDQDLDELQWNIVLDMEKAFGSQLFIVGDDSQAIYEWRGSCPKYLVDHQDEFDIYRLESNYRSVPSIVEASNRLISHNVDRITKTMVATREELLPGPGVSVMKDMDSERIGNLSPFFTCPVAILGRNHFLLEKLSRLLDEKGVKHEYIGRTTALTNSEAFRRYHAFLKLTVNKFDNFSFLLIKDIVGVSKDDYGRIRIAAAETGRSHFEVFLGNTEYLQYKALPGCFLSECCEWIDSAFPELSPEASAFVHNWEKEHPDSIEDYLNWLALYEVQDEIKEKTTGIALMTIHAAKGLEWPVVILAGCNEGIIPSKQSIANGEEESEVRLMYVAMTRARDQLILTCRPEHTEKDGRIYESPTSRFIGWVGL
uniref:DNA 3'-5' helicase n=1 Tax=viral metagenome TaxID=1070528 RepID=A0A6H1ZT69_9ZZZZ